MRVMLNIEEQLTAPGQPESRHARAELQYCPIRLDKPGDLSLRPVRDPGHIQTVTEELTQKDSQDHVGKVKQTLDSYSVAPQVMKIRAPLAMANQNAVDHIVRFHRFNLSAELSLLFNYIQSFTPPVKLVPPLPG